MEPIRILHENVIMDPGGIETQLMRIYRNIDRNKVQFDFLVHRSHKGAYDDEIIEMGGRIFYTAPFNPFFYNKYLNTMRSVLNEHPEYKIIVVHSELALGPLKIAKEAGVPIRICFSHNNQTKINLKRIFLEYEKLFLKKYSTDMFAVSELAARYSFGDKAVDEKKVQYIKNGILIDDFVYDENKRSQKRKELGLEDKFIIGHIGRFMLQKNHMFLLDVFKEILKFREDAHLILIGEGRLEKKIREKIRNLNLENNVSILGRRMDVGELMMAMDMFVFPSFYEGFGNVVMEAQASSLPCIISDTLSDEVVFTEYAYKYPLERTAHEWANRIMEIHGYNLQRRDMSSVMGSLGYDIKKTVKWYEDFYLNAFQMIY